MRKSLSQIIRFGSKTAVTVLDEEETITASIGDGRVTFTINGEKAHLIIPKAVLNTLDERTAKIHIRTITQFIKKDGKRK